MLLPHTAAKTLETLMNQAYLHQLSPGTTPTPANETTETVDSFTTEGMSRYDSTQFYGLLIDTGAAKRSMAGIKQFTAF